MSEDNYSEVTSQSWFGRIGGAIKGVLIGAILFAIAFPVLFWNEGRAVKTYKSLKEGGGAVISVSSDSVDSSNSGKLVHISGQALTNEQLIDSEFGVSVNAIKLKRIGEMYQWDEDSKSETKKKVGGGTDTITTYSYHKIWSENLIDSSAFEKSSEHTNPNSMHYQSREYVAKDVEVGAFRLSKELIKKINNYTPYNVDAITDIPPTLEQKIQKHDGKFYLGVDPISPKIGDLRIGFQTAPFTLVSLIAKQVGNTFETYTTKAGGSIQLLQLGTHSADEMFQKAQKDNTTTTWILRFVGFLIMMIGLNMIFKPLSVLADVLPLLGNIVEIGTGFVAFLLAAILSLITIAIAWILFRPVIGIALIVVAIILVIIISRKLKKVKA